MCFENSLALCKWEVLITLCLCDSPSHGFSSLGLSKVSSDSFATVLPFTYKKPVLLTQNGFMNCPEWDLIWGRVGAMLVMKDALELLH